MPSRSLRLPAQTLRNFEKIMLAVKRPEEDTDIICMLIGLIVRRWGAAEELPANLLTHVCMISQNR